jgi:hypothetical protein
MSKNLRFHNTKEAREFRQQMFSQITVKIKENPVEWFVATYI